MAKIEPINVINRVNKVITKEQIKHIATITPPIAITGLTVANNNIIFSTFNKDYKKTVNDNYFQFKIDKETGEPYKPDIFQNAAAKNLYLGNDVLVTAPTGTGKTAIALYAITKNLNDGNRTFYTTPLKALSNEKFSDFQKIFSEENVGLITGDTKINTEAPIIIMTTEVYRNMTAGDLFDFSPNKRSSIPENLKTVIFDELQYLGDVDRGGIWEQSIMFTPKNVQILSLSATIENNEEINNWISLVKNQRSIAVTPDKNYKPNLSDVKETVLINVPAENRHVPLNFEIHNGSAEIKVPDNCSKKKKLRIKQEALKKAQSIYAKPDDNNYKVLTEKLKKEDKLPAIYFIFSKKECRYLLRVMADEGINLNSDEEQKQIKEILNRFKSEDIYLGESLNIDALMKGYAVHNAGMLPTQKRLIEELFQKKLVKVVLATETLSAGINMPARTTVISSPRKPSSTSDGGEDKKRGLSANEFHQMAGRAGRRGIDTEGFCLPLTCNPKQTELYTTLMDSPSNRLDSNLQLDFSFIAKYMAEFIDEEELRYILSKSFYAYNPKGGVNYDKLKELIQDYRTKRNILKKDNYIDKDNKLTTKGQLIKELNGYEQIPIINLIANKTLADLNPKQIAGIVGGLANIEYHTKDDLPQKPFEVKNKQDATFEKIALEAEKEFKSYNSKVADLYTDKEIKINPRTMDHIYKWAELNEDNDNIIENWKNLYSGEFKFSIRDEGTLFKEINMTIDLLKQLVQITDIGILYSENDKDKGYYAQLKENIQGAINLINGVIAFS